MTETAPDAPVHRSTKCCGKCAFRPGSEEREDGYAWISLAEKWKEGTPFYCHESVPGHRQEVQDDRPRWRTCAGWEAHRRTAFANALKPIGLGEITEDTVVGAPIDILDFEEEDTPFID